MGEHDGSALHGLGLRVIIDPYVPGPRPIRVGEWAQGYVRHHLKQRDRTGALRTLEAPHRAPEWTDQIHTAYLLPTSRSLLPAIDQPVEMLGVERADFAAEVRRYHRLHHARVSWATVAPDDFPVVITSGVV